MKNPLTEKIECEFKQVGINNSKLIFQSYEPKCFGNAEAIYQLGNLFLQFIRDRGQDILDIACLANPNRYYSFPEVSLMMGWQSLDEIINLTAPIELNTAFGYIKNNLESLEDKFSAAKILTTSAEFEDA